MQIIDNMIYNKKKYVQIQLGKQFGWKRPHLIYPSYSCIHSAQCEYNMQMHAVPLSTEERASDLSDTANIVH